MTETDDTFPGSIAIAGAWGYIGRKFLDVALARIGREIFVRTAALYGSFLVASAVLARVGEDALGAHQIAFQLFVFLALVLDALAIAAQVLVGRRLGAGDAAGARTAAARAIVWSVLYPGNEHDPSPTRPMSGRAAIH